MSVLLLLASAATAATWTVHPDGAGDFTDIPSAIAAAHSGDRVEVATFDEIVERRLEQDVQIARVSLGVAGGNHEFEKFLQGIGS